MALLFIDGFDQYRTTAGIIDNYAGHWEPPTSNAANFSYATDGITGGCAQRSGRVGDGPYRVIDSATFLGVGFHYQTNAAANFSCLMFQTAVGGVICSLYIDSNSVITLRSSSFNGTIVATSPTPITLNEWEHFELQVGIAGASSTYEVRLNGQTIMQGTANFGTTPIGRVSLGYKTGAATTGEYRWDNFYIYDDSGTDNNDWLGERNIYTLFPDGDSSPMAWSPSTGSTGYEILDNVPALPATAYLEASSNGTDGYFDLPAPPSLDINVIGVQVSAFGEKTGTSDTELEVGLLTNSVETSGSNLPLIQDSPRFVSEIFERNPDTTDPWTPQEIRDAEVFVKRVV